MFHGNGGYTWDTVYNMPIWLRKYTFKRLKKWYEDQNQEEDLNDATNTKREVFKPSVPSVPTYRVPAPKK